MFAADELWEEKTEGSAGHESDALIKSVFVRNQYIAGRICIGEVTTTSCLPDFMKSSID